MALRSILLSEADVRFVCATNRDLAASVRERHLREDFSRRRRTEPFGTDVVPNRSVQEWQSEIIR